MERESNIFRSLEFATAFVFREASQSVSLRLRTEGLPPAGPSVLESEVRLLHQDGCPSFHVLGVVGSACGSADGCPSLHGLGLIVFSVVPQPFFWWGLRYLVSVGKLFTNLHLDGLTCEMRTATADCRPSQHVFVGSWRRRARYEDVDSIFALEKSRLPSRPIPLGAARPGGCAAA